MDEQENLELILGENKNNKEKESIEEIFTENSNQDKLKKKQKAFNTFTNELNIRYCHEREIREKRTQLLKLKS